MGDRRRSSVAMSSRRRGSVLPENPELDITTSLYEGEKLETLRQLQDVRKVLVRKIRRVTDRIRRSMVKNATINGSWYKLFKSYDKNGPGPRGGTRPPDVPSSRRRGRRPDIPPSARGGAAAASRIFRRALAAAPRLPAGYSAERSRRRLGCQPDIPPSVRGGAAAATRIFRGTVSDSNVAEAHIQDHARATRRRTKKMDGVHRRFGRHHVRRALLRHLQRTGGLQAGNVAERAPRRLGRHRPQRRQARHGRGVRVARRPRGTTPPRRRREETRTADAAAAPPCGDPPACCQGSRAGTPEHRAAGSCAAWSGTRSTTSSSRRSTGSSSRAGRRGAWVAPRRRGSGRRAAGPSRPRCRR